MTGYFIRRVIQMVVVVFVSAVATYALLNFAPGGPLSGLRQTAQNSKFRITEEDFARIRAYYELDLYLPIRFSRWLIGEPNGPIIIGGKEYFANTPVGCRKSIEALVRLSDGSEETRTIGCSEYVYLSSLANRRSSLGVIRGDFGLSWRLLRDRPVSDLILSRLSKTLELMGLSILISLIVGVPLGIYSAIRQYSRFDYFVTTLAFFGSSMPTFFFGLLLILLFSIVPKGLNWPYLPPGSSEAVRDYIVPLIGNITAGSALDRFLHIILPAVVLSMAYVAGWSRFVRASMLDVLRNALIPFITVAVFAIPALFGGAIITESIFSWPGMGRLYILALGDYDYPVAMALLLITAVLTVFATLLQDILYTIVDPRIRLG
jgi:peptide/nickel transport system permease protein